MSRVMGLFSFLKTRCLTHEEFYAFLTQPHSNTRLERPLSRCRDCRDRLLGLRKLLDDDQEAMPEPDPEEIKELLQVIGQAADTKKAQPRSYYQTIGIAAALFVVVGFGMYAIKDFRDKRKAEFFLAQARFVLEQDYSAESPSGFRLDLPFTSKATMRDSRTGDDELTESQHLLYQALAVKPGMREAHLGLGYVFLQKGRFARAREEFQTVLDQQDDYQALLGRGVALAEEAEASADRAERDRDLQSALADFEAALRKNPDSTEALYNKIRTLHELGRITEAIRITEEYLASDGTSLWAERLKNLRAQKKLRFGFKAAPFWIEIREGSARFRLGKPSQNRSAIRSSFKFRGPGRNHQCGICGLRSIAPYRSQGDRASRGTREIGRIIKLLRVGQTG